RLAAQREHVLPGDLDRALRHAAVPRQVADERKGSGRLAAPRLADEPIAALLRDLEADAAHDLAVAAPYAIDDLEVLNGERHAHVSSAPCTASAIRLIPTTSDAIASAGKITAHHASVMSEYCSAICNPQSGDGGCGP